MARVGAHSSLFGQLRSHMPDICANCTLLAKEPCFLIYMELKSVDVVSELERKNAASANRRKNQPRFRRKVLGEEPRCIIVPDGDTCRFSARIAVCCGDIYHGILGNAFGDTESGWGKDFFGIPSPHNSTTRNMDACQLDARRSLFRCCFQCPANAGFRVFRGALPRNA